MTLYIVGHKNPDTDSVCAAIALATLKNKIGGSAVACMQGELNPETKFVLDRFDVNMPEILKDGKEKDLALVDHTEVSQSVENIGLANIKMIVDHHKLGDITTSTPLEVLIKPVGSTCTIIKSIYDSYNVIIPSEIAGIMLCAILSDCVIFKSSTTTEEDKQTAKDLADIAGVDDMEELGMEMFKVKSAIEGVSVKDLVMRDYKDFDMSGKRVGIGQLELVDLSMLDDIKDDLYEELKRLKEEGRHSVFLLLTDIMKEGSEMMYVSDDSSVIEKAFGKIPEGENVWLEGVMSRKKQVVPFLEKSFSTM
ncbi:MAG: manganese-dependent inorganic pyrophosphatase [Nanoarchaeota archaeon]|nr:manganese-dependent inorganic pyrophosphatase [Nanoarchaeota archaeon]